MSWDFCLDISPHPTMFFVTKCRCFSKHIQLKLHAEMKKRPPGLLSHVEDPRKPFSLLTVGGGNPNESSISSTASHQHLVNSNICLVLNGAVKPFISFQRTSSLMDVFYICRYINIYVFLQSHGVPYHPKIPRYHEICQSSSSAFEPIPIMSTWLAI